jgi:hypothetical protein
MPNPTELARQAENLDDQQWYEFLDALDEVSRRRRQQRDEEDRPADMSRDSVAHWIAGRHFAADRSIREVWYLPIGAPSEEIRLIEINDFHSGPDETPLTAVDFGLDLDGCDFRLLVVDITSDQADQVRQGTLALPDGWAIDGMTIWRRGA